MATLIAAYRGDGTCIGRCDASCYNAKGPKCNCICRGANHGIALARALQRQTHDWLDQLNAQVRETDPRATIEDTTLGLRGAQRTFEFTPNLDYPQATQPSAPPMKPNSPQPQEPLRIALLRELERHDGCWAEFKRTLCALADQPHDGPLNLSTIADIAALAVLHPPGLELIAERRPQPQRSSPMDYHIHNDLLRSIADTLAQLRELAARKTDHQLRLVLDHSQLVQIRNHLLTQLANARAMYG